MADPVFKLIFVYNISIYLYQIMTFINIMKAIIQIGYMHAIDYLRKKTEKLSGYMDPVKILILFQQFFSTQK